MGGKYKKKNVVSNKNTIKINISGGIKKRSKGKPCACPRPNNQAPIIITNYPQGIQPSNRNTPLGTHLPPPKRPPGPSSMGPPPATPTVRSTPPALATSDSSALSSDSIPPVKTPKSSKSDSDSDTKTQSTKNSFKYGKYDPQRNNIPTAVSPDSYFDSSSDSSKFKTPKPSKSDSDTKSQSTIDSNVYQGGFLDLSSDSFLSSSDSSKFSTSSKFSIFKNPELVREKNLFSPSDFQLRTEEKTKETIRLNQFLRNLANDPTEEGTIEDAIREQKNIASWNSPTEEIRQTPNRESHSSETANASDDDNSRLVNTVETPVVSYEDIYNVNKSNGSVNHQWTENPAKKVRPPPPNYKPPAPPSSTKSYITTTPIDTFSTNTPNFHYSNSLKPPVLQTPDGTSYTSPAPKQTPLSDRLPVVGNLFTEYTTKRIRADKKMAMENAHKRDSTSMTAVGKRSQGIEPSPTVIDGQEAEEEKET